MPDIVPIVASVVPIFLFGSLIVEKLGAIRRGLHAFRWHPVDAIVTSSGSGRQIGRLVHWQFGYAYRMEGVEMYGHTFRSGHPTLVPLYSANTLSDRYPIGSKITVYVNTHSVRESVVMPGVGSRVWGSLVLSMIALAITFAFLVYTTVEV